MDTNIDILIVEDSRTQALRLQIFLEEQGYQVAVASDGREGMHLLIDRFYPVVITDWVMPEMDGFEFCQAIRNRDFDAYVYIILLTAKDTRSDIVKGLVAGADDYLIKPVDKAELVARLNTAKRIINLEHSLKQRNEEIAILSITDTLTRTFNRRYLNENMPVALKRTFRYNRPLSVIICDIDHFKRVNDRYGHLAGDHVLKEFAGTIKECIRDDIDWLVRYGGEEFVIVLPETDLVGAMDAAERYRKKVEEMSVRHDDRLIRITSSFGVVCIMPTEDGKQVDMDTFIAAADNCLYRAKEEGRNQSFGITLG